MGKLIRRRWEAPFDLGTGRPKRDRASCDYDVYVPDPLVGHRFTFEGPVAADIVDAERAITRLNAQALSIVDTEALARLLLRAESVASSKIEGLEIGARRLLRADAAQQYGETPNDVTAVEVLANVNAMSYATQTINEGDPLSVQFLLEVHQRLLAPTHLASHAGRIRSEQNWIGGSSYNPCSAAFVPPPPEMVESLLEDLCSFCNDDSLPAVAQAAIAHAQFEAIHPFADGNGRVGRALIHVLFRRRGLVSRVSPPISLVLATQAKDYIGGLNAAAYVGTPDSQAAHDGVNIWVERFASACNRAVKDTEAFEQRIQSLQDTWRQRIGPVRSDSAIEILFEKLPGVPVLTAQSAADFTKRSVQAVNEAITRLVEAGILVQIRTGRRNRAFEASEIVDAFTDLERRLASPAGDTRVAPPTRKVPRH